MDRRHGQSQGGVLDWTVALFFRPDITKVELRVEREQVRRARDMAAGAVNQARR